jgi:benzoate-CoA ligase family protein
VRTAAGLRELGLQPEQRLLIFMPDAPELVVLFLAALRIGAVPVPVSTMCRAGDLTTLLNDSRARFLAVTADFAAVATAAAAQAPDLTGIIVGEGCDLDVSVPVALLSDLARTNAADGRDVYGTWGDSPGFWLYTSGTTGEPKGAMHRHASVRIVCETYGAQVLGIRPNDRCLSVAKAFFAYGLGNSILFPMSVGATAILEPSPSRADVISTRAREFGATLFFAGPTFFANMLKAELPTDALKSVRLAVSAGEALPTSLYERWTTHFGIDILDGIGMTEMLHIFLSNRPSAVRPGTTGVAVPGYELRIVDDERRDVADGTPGTLLVRGDSAAVGYWSRYAHTRSVFEGEWLRTGDTYLRDDDGFYHCLGRVNDMLKASGMWVAPSEVEEVLLGHSAVAQAVVVGGIDGDGLEKPVAFVVLKDHDVTEQALIDHCRERLPSFKSPRCIAFVTEYPTTATGKVRRVELRAQAADVLAAAAVGRSTLL